MPKLDKDTTRKESYKSLSLMNINAAIKIPWSSGIYFRDAKDGLTSEKQLSVTYHINKIKDKNDMII